MKEEEDEEKKREKVLSLSRHLLDPDGSQNDEVLTPSQPLPDTLPLLPLLY